MPSPSDRSGERQTRTYQRASSVVFLKTDGPFGGLSNMAGGFSLRVNGMRILTSEALYQACRFPHRLEVQRLIIEQKSPMTAKMKSKPYRRDSRPDWDQVRVKIMRWCLRVKLAQNWGAFSGLLLETGERQIVEESRKDDFWGAKATDEGTLVGMNVLGRLLMELREAIKAESSELLMRVQPLAIPEFLLGGRSIGIVTSQDAERDAVPVQAASKLASGDAADRAEKHPSLFDMPTVKEAPSPAYVGIRTRSVRIADLKPYPEYKESGLPWLGQVPKHWSVERTKWRFRHRKELNADGDHTNILSLTLRGVVNNNPDDPEGLVPKDYRTYQFFAKGDLVFKLIDLENLRTSRVGLVHENGIMSSAYVRLVPSSPTNMRYSFYQFHDLYSRGIYNQLGAGVRSTLGPSDLLNIAIVIPPPDEQATIVRFLDWMNGRMERTIRAKRKVIALLNEQKQAIIHHAVTRGLDPSVALKPSGIPWLGDIPQHWAVRRAKYLFQEVDERSGDGREELLSVSHLTGVTPRSQKSITMFKAASYAGHKLCRPGDLVVNTMWAWMGALGVSTYTGIISPAYAVYRPRRPEGVVGLYVDGLLRSRPYVSNIVCRSTGLRASRLRLYPEEFFRLPIIQPPAEEQRRIVERTHAETAALDSTISSLDREISLLREYRIRLVADVVTGKLDVREAAARVPDEAQLDTVGDDADLSEEIEAADEEAAA